MPPRKVNQESGMNEVLKSQKPFAIIFHDSDGINVQYFDSEGQAFDRIVQLYRNHVRAEFFKNVPINAHTMITLNEV